MNLDYENYKTSDLEELNQKISKRFIRNIVKPYNNDLKKPTTYQIPRSSDLLRSFPSNPKTAIPVEFFTEKRSSAPSAPSRPVDDSSQYGQFSIPPHRRSTIYNTNVDISKTFSPETYRQKPVTPTPIYVPTPVEPNCKNVHQHVHSCKICSQLYKPYNHILMIIIVILILIILFMMKKIYNF